MCKKIGLFHDDGTTLEKEELPIPGAPMELNVLAGALGLLRSAKEQHVPVLITNEDETRALYIKDANGIKCKISIKEIGFEKEI